MVLSPWSRDIPRAGWTLPSLGTGKRHPTQPDKQQADVHVDGGGEVKDDTVVVLM